MDRQHALKILGLNDISDKRIIKKKYRALMHVVHPDARSSGNECAYRYSAHEINAAYEYLMNEAEVIDPVFKKKKSGEQKRWNAPVNDSAYAKREIYQYVEGVGGTGQGMFCAARGKYLRIADEDQKLFLLSIYNLSRSLLDPFGEEAVLEHQAELAYLLFRQFSDPERDLERYLVSEKNGVRIYYISAMLETGGKGYRLNDGDILYPSGVRDHRLYVKRPSGDELGYVSFADDMLYQTVVPLFEQRSVQVRIRVSGSTFGNNSVRKVVVKNLDLWIRAEHEDRSELTLSISSKIDEILKSCGR